MKIADVQMTGEWESALAKIESGEMRDDTFRKGIEIYAKQVTTELLKANIRYRGTSEQVCCPKCKKGNMVFLSTVVKCDNKDCELPIFRNIAGKTISDRELSELITNGKTRVIKGFVSRTGKSFEASLSFDDSYKVVFNFPDKKKTKKSRK